MPKNNSGFHFEGKTSNFFNFLYFILMNITDVHFFIFFRSGHSISKVRQVKVFFFNFFLFCFNEHLLMFVFFIFLGSWMPKNNSGFHFKGKTSNFFSFLYFILMNVTDVHFLFFLGPDIPFRRSDR
jgi:hypothetical protein